MAVGIICRLFAVALTLASAYVAAAPDVSCFDSLTSVGPFPALIWLKQYSLDECKVACRYALEVYDFRCSSIGHYAKTLDCVLYGNESATVTHAKRWTSTALPSGTATLFKNSCEKPKYQCVDQTNKCAYQKTGLCQSKGIVTNKSTTVSGKTCQSWSNSRFPEY
ncbi:uncharacterized protein LOC129597616 [Paramacrobiotus metropolitanus]|uniref:uncharacterized protein LOC129597616 n=1 Tax=Paramacrobiotus metropolitanus TaxID=2943436 RepID=UPI0024461497|nr:uncharacterized protein LOC129597616 [Paramacrobiotus metropolitanus]